MFRDADRFFEVLPDHEGFPDQWFLNDPVAADGSEILPEDFVTHGRYHGTLPVRLSVGNPGRELAFNLGPYEMPVVESSLSETIRQIAPNAAEFFPVRINGARGRYEIMNVYRSVECLDETHSIFTRWGPEDERPDRTGSLKMISRIIIDPKRAKGSHLFRITGWPLALLVSERLKCAIEGTPNLGILFGPVT
jgi:hypothetical protein